MRFFKKCFLFLWIIEFLLIGTGHYMAVATRVRKKMSHPATQAATLPLQSPYLGLTSKHTFLAALSRSKSHVVTNQRSQNVTVMNNLKFPINPLCYPWDSCIGRCGQDFSHLTFYCYCDSMCLTYGDCCVDFLTHCRTNETLEIFQRMSKRMNRRYPTCWVEDELSWPYLIVDACPTFSMNDSVKNMCEGVDKNVSVNLVLGEDGLLYANKKCADCNGVTIVVSEQDFNIQNNWYVTSNENYTNVHVLQNSNSKSPYFEGKKKQKLKRHCSPSISSCKYKGLQLQGYKLDWLCLVHSGTIVSRTSRQLKEAETLYKNVYCALCNGENLDMLSCLTWIIHDPGNFSSFNEPLNSISKHWLTELDNLHAGKIPSYRTRNKVQHDIPAAFSILLNFGLDGKERIIFSSEGEEEMRRNMARCKPGQMWDPFSNICRKLYCSTEFILVDFRCVHKNEIDDEKNSDVGGDVILADVDSKYVMLVLIIRMDYLDALDLVKNGKFDLNESVRTSLATVYKITTNRIQDIHITMQTIFIMPNDTQKEIEYKISTNKQIEEFLSYSIFANPVVLKVKFKLFEPYGNLTKSEPSVDSIVSSMSSSVAQNTFYLDIHNKTSKVFEIHENVEAMSDWCGIGSGGKQLEYWNQEFTLILNENFTAVDTWVRSVYINRTGRIYEKGIFNTSFSSMWAMQW
ncbi:uncharacterized protein LOC106464506 [Limulus polyphemus]|uniref:Uncharacterized protein LOC106464506 n=1 Tax=Limulus polyphemus TaxID=6850 RepID=A0ABM1SWE3_LIMPO|nr:uncharacterized protein LOC106464506 [Limulus polyphemus]